MDLAIGAKQVFVLMELQTRKGESKLVADCTYPLTGLRCASRVYTDVGVFALGPSGARVIELVSCVSLEEVRERTGLPLGVHEVQQPRSHMTCYYRVKVTAADSSP